MISLLSLSTFNMPGPDNDFLFAIWILFQVPAVRFVLLVAFVAVFGTILMRWLDPTGDDVRRKLYKNVPRSPGDPGK